MKPFEKIKQAIEDIKAGRMVIMVDDEDRENEGDLVFAAELVTPEAINFMTKYARGLICLPMTGEDLDRLQLSMMTDQNRSEFETAFTVSIEAATGVTTGISAHDRARTIQVAVDPDSTAADIISPGHIFPLRAKSGGVLVRTGQTEGSVDLMKIAGLRPAAVICEIMNDDGSMARMDDLIKFSKEHDIKIISIDDLIAYRLEHECHVVEVAKSKLPISDSGEFDIRVIESTIDGCQHVVLQKGEINPDEPTLVRVHSECLTGDAFGSSRCDCGWQLQASIDIISKEGGVLLYMSQEGRGIGLANKIKAYALQEHGLDTVEANHKLGFKDDHRDYGIGSQILRFLGIKKMRLLTNNPRKIYGIGGFGIEIVCVEPIIATPNKDNIKYLKTKQNKLGHILNL